MAMTVLHRLADWAEAAPQSAAQRYKSKGEWKTITALDFCNRVYYLALFLESRGLTPADIGTLFAYNSAPWVTVELALMLMGGKSAGLYPNSTQSDAHYILEHTETRFLAVQDKEYYKRIVGERGEKPLPKTIETLLVFDGDTSISPNAVSYEAALAQGRKLSLAPGAKKLEDYLAKVDPKAGAFMIYTSGTTGRPKGAILSHDNLAYTSDLAVKHWKLPRKGSMFSFLPLCHIAEKLQTVGVGISMRYTVSYASQFDKVATELPEVEPTILLCVPRLWEKMMEGVQDKLANAPKPRQALANWALAVGGRVSAAKFAGEAPAVADQLQLKIADKLVLGKVRKALGLGKAEFVASGAAPLPPKVANWFRQLSLEIYEDYGQTESTGVICMTEPGVESAGTVGIPVPGTEFKLAPDGEILTRGRHVFLGYFKNEQATAETVDSEGWLHTGDLGAFDEKGLVVIRGRKKEILKTSGGKMVAPLPIEEKLKAAGIISQVCMVGDNRKYLVALITLSENLLKEVQKKQGAASADNVIQDSEILSQVRQYVDELNQTLASYEQIKKFTVLSREFSIAEGEMTPTLKMKRNVIETRFRDVIDRMYE